MEWAGRGERRVIIRDRKRVVCYVGCKYTEEGSNIAKECLMCNIDVTNRKVVERASN